MKRLYIALIVCLHFVFTVFPVKAELITFDGILNQATKNSYDLKISNINTKISEKGITEARSEYFPTVSTYFNAEYSDYLADGYSSVTYVGNEALLNSDLYQNTVSVGVSYNVFDFGQRGKKLKIAKKDKEQKETIEKQALRDLRLDLSEIYARSLVLYKEYKTQQELLSIQGELYKINQRLNKAGKVRKTDVVNEAIRVAELTTQMNDVKGEYAKVLKELTFYTRQAYDTSSLEIEDFEKDGIVDVSYTKGEPIKLEAEVNTFIEEKTPEYKIYDLEIAKKQRELEILRRQNLPTFRFDARYYLYGTDTNNLWQSMGNLSNRSVTFRLTSVMPIFDGLKNRTQKQKAKLEVEKLTIQKDQALADLEKKFEQIKQDSTKSLRNLEQSQEAPRLVNKNLEMVEQLKENKLISQSDYLNQKADLLNKKLTLEKTKIDNFKAYSANRANLF